MTESERLLAERGITLGEDVRHKPTGRVGMYDGYCNCPDHKACKEDQVVILGYNGSDIIANIDDIELDTRDNIPSLDQ